VGQGIGMATEGEYAVIVATQGGNKRFGEDLVHLNCVQGTRVFPGFLKRVLSWMGISLHPNQVHLPFPCEFSLVA